MCLTCDKIRARGLTGLARDAALRDIAAALRAGPRRARHFDPLMDEILGTKGQEQDPALDEAWEKAYRGDV